MFHEVVGDVDNQQLILNTRMAVWTRTQSLSIQLSSGLFKRSEVNYEGSGIKDILLVLIPS